MNVFFRRLSSRASDLVGRPWAFLLAVILLLVWAISGPAFGFSDSWQLVINTGTTIVTFLMVFLIQNTQNRDAKAIHLKLDELIRAVRGARTELVDLEECTDEELEQLARDFQRMRVRLKGQLQKTMLEEQIQQELAERECTVSEGEGQECPE